MLVNVPRDESFSSRSFGFPFPQAPGTHSLPSGTCLTLVEAVFLVPRSYKEIPRQITHGVSKCDPPTTCASALGSLHAQTTCAEPFQKTPPAICFQVKTTCAFCSRPAGNGLHSSSHRFEGFVFGCHFCDCCFPGCGSFINWVSIEAECADPHEPMAMWDLWAASLP